MGTGGLLLGLGGFTYLVFTLLPNSSTRMVSFPWVLILQAGMLCLAMACSLRLWQSKQKFLTLGNGLDWAIAAIGVATVISTLLAQFPNYAILYGLNVLFALTGIYGVVNWCHGQAENWQKLVYGQALLSMVVSVESLLLWTWNIFLPRLQSIQETNQTWGTALFFDFSDLLNRNADPFGHPNYTAGYLILALPLLVSLAIAGRRRWVWWLGIGLSILTLYTTSSRGGFLGLVGWLVAGVIGLAWQGSLSRVWLFWGSGTALGGVALLIFLNTRLRNVAIALASGVTTGFAEGGGELLYRMVTTVAGWRMGLAHWFSGAGMGAVFLSYQRFRPEWAGREAEMLFQLHSTPVQIWAELGLVGILATLVTIICLGLIFVKLHRSLSWRENNFDRSITYGLFGGLWGYGLLAITDFQLDVPGIYGSIIIMVGLLAFIAQKHCPQKHCPSRELSTESITEGSNTEPRVGASPIMKLGTKFRPIINVTVTLVTVISLWWIIPFLSAWQTANLGFLAIGNTYLDLHENKIESAQTNFQNFGSRLQSAHQQVPWYIYYPYQIAWNLGNVSQLFPRFIEPRQLQTESLEWWKKSIELNPNFEFPFTNGGYLSLRLGNYPQAIDWLSEAIKLAPHKRSLHFMLGDAQIKNIIDRRDNDPRSLDQALNNLTQELIYDPLSVTHSVWTDELWSSLLQNRIMPLLERNLQTHPNLSATDRNNLQLSLATLKWWIGDPQAIALLKATQHPTALAIVEVMENKFVPVDSTSGSPIRLVLSAFYKPEQRLELLTRAYGISNLRVPNPDMVRLLQAMAESMGQFSDPVAWLRQRFPESSPFLNKYRVGGAGGFSVNNRNIDGAGPFDFWRFQESWSVSLFLRDLFPGVLVKLS